MNLINDICFGVMDLRQRFFFYADNSLANPQDEVRERIHPTFKVITLTVYNVREDDDDEGKAEILARRTPSPVFRVTSSSSSEID